jgi:hypothetical protein
VIALVGSFQVRAVALVQFRPLDLDPAPDATGVDKQTTFQCHLGHVRKGDRKPPVPPHAPENDLARIVAPFEGIRRGNGHVSPYQILIRFSQRYLLPFHPITSVVIREAGAASLRDFSVVLDREGVKVESSGVTPL